MPSPPDLSALLNTSSMAAHNAAYLEDLYETFLQDPHAVSGEWREYFDKLMHSNGGVVREVPRSAVRREFRLLSGDLTVAPMLRVSADVSHEIRQVRVLRLISAYRQRGHQKAQLDPLGLMKRENVPDLQLKFHQLGSAELDMVFQTGDLHIGKVDTTLGEIVAALESTYCRHIGAEFMHITGTEEREWLQERMESVRAAPEYAPSMRLHLLERLTAAEGLENLLASRYPGTKRFGLEGGESLIPALDALIQRAGSNYQVKEIVLGMAHRGRLNVLVNILGKNPAELFEEFEHKVEHEGSGDVKYHQGFSSNIHTPGGELHLALAFNPSHLEIVAPVVEGSVRARQDRRRNLRRDRVIPVIVHGDASFAGQGVVMESLQMSQTRAYSTGGTVHIVLNNQIGFTTSRQEDARSTEYCTDVAKMVQAPIFHVNADDPEAVLFVTEMAMDFRQSFRKDVVIDLVCYRRHGHNEADAPDVSQPVMYARIRERPQVRALYQDHLCAAGLLTPQQGAAMQEEYRSLLESGAHVAKSLVSDPDTALFVDWSSHLKQDWQQQVETHISEQRLQEVAQHINRTPEGFTLHPQVQRILADRRKMAAGARPINWGYAELLAYGSLLQEGHNVRLTGQDVRRGTFAHRHAVLHDQASGARHGVLAGLAPDSQLAIYDSLLSELAVLGFEYGYATTSPNTLVIWEAQFGDFANGAQIVIDQFITSGEYKWQRLCGLVMLLPHGHDGQGPEHSSARLERFLQLAGENNIQICMPTTPAQIFHLLRRQMIRSLRRPLVVFTPKSLLRHQEAASSLEALVGGAFHNVLPDEESLEPAKVRRVLLCSGKLYYELLAARRERKCEHIALVRLEQLYPFPYLELGEILVSYENLRKVLWCQEEPRNQGAWYLLQHRIRRVLELLPGKPKLEYVGREPSASTAPGYLSLHVGQQEGLVQRAFA